jgi:glycosyltransferase involved in cell wall biosynthesis
VTQGCGASEVVQDGLTGFTVPSGDAHVLASRMDAILTDTTLGPAMGKAGGIALRAYTPRKAAVQEAGVLERARRRFEREAR